jgi:N-acetylneuraminic acid mutarotase
MPAMPASYWPGASTTVWTGSQMIIHALRYSPGTKLTSVTLSYRPASNSWQHLARGPGPATIQTSDVAIWTGSEMLVPGLTNGAYNPATNTWRPLPHEPSANGGAVTAWTGHQAIIWDGVCCDGTSNRGVAYLPATNTWQVLPDAPLARRRNAMGAWTGSELVVAGGMSRSVPGPVARIYHDGAAYNPVTRSWRKLPPMPGGRYGGIALWDGSEVLFLGGYATGGSTPAARGLAYNPAANRWRVLPAMPYPRSGFAAVWTGHLALVWGGLMGPAPARVPPPHGEAYDPATNRWTALPESPLHGRGSPAAVWTGTEMIACGGSIPSDPQPTIFTDGAAYTPASP